MFGKIFFIPCDSCFCLYRQNIAIVQRTAAPGLALKNQKSKPNKTCECLFYKFCTNLTGGVHEHIDFFAYLYYYREKRYKIIQIHLVEQYRSFELVTDNVEDYYQLLPVSANYVNDKIVINLFTIK